MIYYGLKANVVQFAIDLQVLSENDSQSTTITRVGKSAVYCVSIATATLSVETVETVAQACYLERTNIWSETIRAMPSHLRLK